MGVLDYLPRDEYDRWQEDERRKKEQRERQKRQQQQAWQQVTGQQYAPQPAPPVSWDAPYPPQEPQYFGLAGAQQAAGMQPTATPDYQPVQQSSPPPTPPPTQVPSWDAPYPEPVPLQQPQYLGYAGAQQAGGIRPEPTPEYQPVVQQPPPVIPPPAAAPPMWDAPQPQLQQPNLAGDYVPFRGMEPPQPEPISDAWQTAAQQWGQWNQQAQETIPGYAGAGDVLGKVGEGLQWGQENIQYPALEAAAYIGSRGIEGTNPAEGWSALGEGWQRRSEPFPGFKGIIEAVADPINFVPGPNLGKIGQLAARGTRAVREAAPALGRAVRAGAESLAEVPVGLSVKPVEGEFAPTFYSQLGRALESPKMPNKASAEQILGTLKAQGVKDTELEATGVKALLDERMANRQAVTKQELQEAFDVGQVRVEETVKGAPLPIEWKPTPQGGSRSTNGRWEIVPAHEQGENRFIINEITPGGPIRRESFYSLTEAQDYAPWHANSPTKHSKWQVPGAEPGSYRELLLTLPEEGPASQRSIRFMDALEARYGDQWGTRMTQQERTKHAALLSAAEDEMKSNRPYTTGHWEEPNVLAHVRFNDRTDAAGKKVLFIEEIQSDWHQAGRQRGYKVPGRDSQQIAAERDALMNEARERGYLTVDALPAAMRQRYVALDTELYEAYKVVVPDAPFKKTWPELAMKRMIRWAGENGYDRIAWTTGKQQADRYNLAQYVDAIKWTRQADGNYELGVYRKEVRSPDIYPHQTPEQVRELIGAELSQKVMASPDGYLQGLDLQMGGEGMSSFYDRELVNIANDLGKKYGGRVGVSDVSVGRPTGNVYHIAQGPEGWLILNQNGQAILPPLADRTSAEARLAILQQAVDRGPMASVHSLDIPDAMKKVALYEGQRLFAAPEATGAVIGGALGYDPNATLEENAQRIGMGAVGGALGAKALTRGIKALPKAGLSVEDVGRLADDAGELVARVTDEGIPPSGNLPIRASEAAPAPGAFEQLNERYKAVQDRLASLEDEIGRADTEAAMYREGTGILRPDRQSPDRAERIVAGWTDDQIRAFAAQERRDPGMADWFDSLDSKAVDEFNKNKGLYASRTAQTREAKGQLDTLSAEYAALQQEQLSIEREMRRAMRKEREAEVIASLTEQAESPTPTSASGGPRGPEGPRPPVESDWQPSGRRPGGPHNVTPYTPPDPYEQLQAALRPDVEPLGGRAKEALNTFMRATYDRNYDLGALEQATGIPVHKLAQVVSGAVAAGEDRVRRFVLPVIEGFDKEGIKRLEEYLVLMRNEDILSRNPHAQLPGQIAGWQGTLQAEKTLARIVGPERMTAIKEAAQSLWQVNDDLILKPLLAEGMLTQESYQAMRSAHPHYIDFHRSDFSLTDAVEKVITRPEASVSSLNIKSMDLAGSVRKLDQPLARTEAQIIRTATLISRNRAAKAIVAALEELEKGLPEVQRKVRRLAPGEAAETSKLTDTVSFLDDGKKVVVQVPAKFAGIAKGMEAESANAWQRIGAALGKPLRTGAVTHNPVFLLVNPLRDAVSAFYREGLIPFSPEYARGWVAAITRNSDFSDAAEAGVLLSGIVDTMRTTEALSRTKGVGSIQVQSWQDALALIPRLVERANIVGEQATRIATYHKLRGQGVKELDAAIRSRDVSVDFAKMGNAMKVVNQMIPFTNAGIQGAANTVRLIKDNPKQALLAGSALSMPSIMAHLWNQRYETANLVPDYEYANNWVFIIGEGQQNPDPRYPDAEPEKFPIYIKVPKGPTGAFITAPIELALRLAWAKDDRSVAEHFLEAASVASMSLSPIEPSASGLLPPVLSTGLGLQTGVDTFRNARIIPRREEIRPPELQYGPETSKVAVTLGERFKVSPRLIEWAIRDYTAGVGQQTMWLSDLALGALGYNPQPPGAGKLRELTSEEQTAKLPGVSRFVGIRNTAQERRGYEVLDATMLEARRQLIKVPELNRLGINFGEPPRDIRVGKGNDERVVELSPTERKEFIATTTDAIESGVGALVKEKYYQSQLDKEKTKLIANVTGKVRDIAREGIKAEKEQSGRKPTVAELSAYAVEYVQALGEYRDYEALTQKYLGLSKDEIQKASVFERRMAEERAKTPEFMRDSDVALMIARKIDPEGARAYSKRRDAESGPLGKMLTTARQRFKLQHPLMRKYFNEGMETLLKEAS